jgi:hypothetical protein
VTLYLSKLSFIKCSIYKKNVYHFKLEAQARILDAAQAQARVKRAFVLHNL